MTKARKPRFITNLTVVVVTLLSSSFIAAKDYKVEVIIFENQFETVAHESYQYQKTAEMSSNAEAWLIEPSLLLDEVAALEKSTEYRVLHHFSWGQESLPISESTAINVIELDVTGWIKVYARHLLFANLDLDFNGYRMSEKRRLKLNEKHFFDHPKFGVIMQVSRLEAPEIATPGIAIPGEEPPPKKYIKTTDIFYDADNDNGTAP